MDLWLWVYNFDKMDEPKAYTDEEIEGIIENIKEHKIEMGFWNLSRMAVVVPTEERTWFDLVSAVQSKSMPVSFRDSCNMLAVQLPGLGFFIFHRRKKGDKKGKSPGLDGLDTIDKPTQFT